MTATVPLRSLKGAKTYQKQKSIKKFGTGKVEPPWTWGLKVLATSRKSNFSNILKTLRLIHQSTQNLMLISKMYNLIGLFFRFYFVVVIFNAKKGPFFQKFKKRALFSIKNYKEIKPKK